MILFLIFLYFVPGYTLTLVLFPNMKVSERLVFSGALSVVADITIVLVLNVVFKMKITSFTILSSLIVFSLICIAIWKVRSFVEASSNREGIEEVS